LEESTGSSARAGAACSDIGCRVQPHADTSCNPVAPRATATAPPDMSPQHLIRQHSMPNRTRPHQLNLVCYACTYQFRVDGAHLQNSLQCAGIALQAHWLLGDWHGEQLMYKCVLHDQYASPLFYYIHLAVDQLTVQITFVGADCAPHTRTYILVYTLKPKKRSIVKRPSVCGLSRARLPSSSPSENRSLEPAKDLFKTGCHSFQQNECRTILVGMWTHFNSLEDVAKPLRSSFEAFITCPGTSLAYNKAAHSFPGSIRFLTLLPKPLAGIMLS
jgi:hypothetical protein